MKEALFFRNHKTELRNSLVQNMIHGKSIKAVQKELYVLMDDRSIGRL